MSKKPRIPRQLLLLSQETNGHESDLFSLMQIHNSLLEQAVDSIPNLVFVKDSQLRFVFVNRALATFVSKSKTEIIHNKDKDIFPNLVEVAGFETADRRVLLSKEPLTIQEEYLTNTDGKSIRLATVKVYCSYKGHDHVVGVATDITGLSQEYDRLRSTIIGDLVHVVNTPISELVMNIENIEAEFSLTQQRGWLLRNSPRWLRSKRWWYNLTKKSALVTRNAIKSIQYAKEASLAIRTTSRTFAAMVQLSSAKRDRQPQLIPLNRAVEDCVKEIKVLLQRDVDAITLEITRHKISVALDPSEISLLKTSLYNLIHNAYKFSKKDNAHINIRLYKKNSGEAVISIADRGVGIPQNDLHRIFDAGFSRRAPGRAEGTGMGLAIVKAVCDLLKWQIETTSICGSGTTFEIFIPADQLTAI